MKETCCTKLFKFLVRHVICPFVLFPFVLILSPIYRLHDAFVFLWFQDRNVSSPSEHRRKVEEVQAQVRGWRAASTNRGGRVSAQPTYMCTARPAWASISVHKVDKSNLAKINLRSLNSVVEIDETTRTVTIEPGLMMGQLTSILLPRGWTIPVVPEFDILSVGGLICGAGVESSSTRYGLMAKSALEFEVVLSSGDVVTCSKDNNAELFYSIPFSHGTIGFLTAVKFPLIPAKKYVKLEYFAVSRLDEAQKLLEAQDKMFVEGIMYGPDKFVIMHGNMAEGDRVGRAPVRHLSRWYSPFFVNHVRGFFRSQKRTIEAARAERRGMTIPAGVELIPLRDYYHRHTRPYFWTVPLSVPISGNRIFLFLFGYVFPFADMRYIQKVGIPLVGPRLYKFMSTMMNISSSSGNGSQSELWIDVGIHGNSSGDARNRFNPVQTLRKFEAFTMSKGGYQLTYAGTCLTCPQFRYMFDMRLYDEVRSRYGALDAFPDVYDKVGKEERAFQADVDV